MYKDKDNAHAYFDYDVALSKRKQTLKLSLLLITIFPKLLLRWRSKKKISLEDSYSWNHFSQLFASP